MPTKQMHRDTFGICVTQGCGTHVTEASVAAAGGIQEEMAVLGVALSDGNHLSSKELPINSAKLLAQIVFVHWGGISSKIVVSPQIAPP